MAERNTGHGHVYPRADGMKARCGGPAICPRCAAEFATEALPLMRRMLGNHTTDPTAGPDVFGCDTCRAEEEARILLGIKDVNPHEPA